MWLMSMFTFLHGVATSDNLLAALVTAGVALLLVCCLECLNCPSRDKDDLFRHHAL
jgi:hypothetical protein